MINLTISGKDFQLTPALKDYVVAKIGRLKKFHPHIQRIGVELDVDHNHQSGQIYRVEVWIHLPGETIQAGLKSDDMRAAIDLVYPKLERQLVRNKEKRRAVRKRQAK